MIIYVIRGFFYNTDNNTQNARKSLLRIISTIGGRSDLKYFFPLGKRTCCQLDEIIRSSNFLHR